jgi:hypothetical protein
MAVPTKSTQCMLQCGTCTYTMVEHPECKLNCDGMPCRLDKALLRQVQKDTGRVVTVQDNVVLNALLTGMGVQHVRLTTHRKNGNSRKMTRGCNKSTCRDAYFSPVGAH